MVQQVVADMQEVDVPAAGALVLEEEVVVLKLEVGALGEQEVEAVLPLEVVAGTPAGVELVVEA